MYLAWLERIKFLQLIGQGSPLIYVLECVCVTFGHACLCVIYFCVFKMCVCLFVERYLCVCECVHGVILLQDKKSSCVWRQWRVCAWMGCNNACVELWCLCVWAWRMLCVLCGIVTWQKVEFVYDNEGGKAGVRFFRITWYMCVLRVCVCVWCMCYCNTTKDGCVGRGQGP